MTKISSIIEDEISWFEWKNAEASWSRERELEKSNDFLFAAGLRETDKGKKWEWVRPYSAKMNLQGPKRSIFRIVYQYGNS